MSLAPGKFRLGKSKEHASLCLKWCYFSYLFNKQGLIKPYHSHIAWFLFHLIEVETRAHKDKAAVWELNLSSPQRHCRRWALLGPGVPRTRRLRRSQKGNVHILYKKKTLFRACWQSVSGNTDLEWILGSLNPLCVSFVSLRTSSGAWINQILSSHSRACSHCKMTGKQFHQVLALTTRNLVSHLCCWESWVLQPSCQRRWFCLPRDLLWSLFTCLHCRFASLKQVVHTKGLHQGEGCSKDLCCASCSEMIPMFWI